MEVATQNQGPSYAELAAQLQEREKEIELLSQEIVDRYEELNMVYELGEQSVGRHNPNEILQHILKYCHQSLNTQYEAVYLWCEDQKQLRYVSSTLETNLKQGEVIPSDTLAQFLLERKEPLMVNEWSQATPLPVSLRKQDASWWIDPPFLVCPMKNGEKVLGLLVVARDRKAEPFQARELKLFNSLASQAAIGVDNVLLIEKILSSERAARDLELARSIQQGMLPHTPPKIEGWDLAGVCMPANMVGGDYYDFMQTKRYLYMVIADVSGHNVGTALLMSSFRTCFRSLATRELSPGVIMEDINRSLFSDLFSANLFISAFIVRMDLASGEIVFDNAGHNPPLWVQKDQCQTLQPDGMILGILEDNRYQEESLQLSPGESLLLYTDGIIESEPREGEDYGMARLKEQLLVHQGKSAAGIRDALVQDLSQWMGSEPINDDVTLALLKKL